PSPSRPPPPNRSLQPTPTNSNLPLPSHFSGPLLLSGLSFPSLALPAAAISAVEAKKLDRRSIAAFDQGSRPSDHYAEHLPGAQARLSGGLTRSQTVLRRESCLSTAAPPPYYEAPLPAWAPEVVQLPTPHEHFEVYPGDDGVGDGGEAVAPMSAPPGKTSSDSGQGGVAGLDRWSQRRLQRLNTEQGFREQRQGSGAAIASPHIGGSSAEPGSIYHHNISQQQQQQQHASASSSYATDHHPTQPPHQPQQQHPAPASSAYQNTRSTPTVSELGSTSSTSRSPSFAAAAHHHPSPDPTSAYVASSSSPHPAADPQHPAPDLRLLLRPPESARHLAQLRPRRHVFLRRPLPSQ
ncbi:hypothetical protein M433DRAFT_297493, partial [Acidomyces richmondensis BFW]